ncbi:questin oxidase family protein [Streptomyces sp. NPDC054796]
METHRPTPPPPPLPDRTGTLDEALERLHASGPERDGWLSNHAPMAVEALVRNGQAGTVHRWIDRYRDKLEDMPELASPVTEDNWQEALGDPRRLADWTVHFTRRLAESPWRDVLAEWWPRLLPGISGGATHPVIRTGHAVRTLLDGEETAPRRAELAHALGYWAARHHFLTGVGTLHTGADEGASGGTAEGTEGAADQADRADPAGAVLASVPRICEQSGGIQERLGRIGALPRRPGPHSPGPEETRAALAALVRAATHRYATHAHGQPVMLVHAATAPNAVLRTLPALPRALWLPSLDAAWTVSTAIVAAYGPAEGAPAPAHGSGHGPATTEEVFALAAAHGDEHTVKLADTALDVVSAYGADDGPTLGAVLRAVELIEPLFPVPGRGSVFR